MKKLCLIEHDTRFDLLWEIHQVKQDNCIKVVILKLTKTKKCPIKMSTDYFFFSSISCVLIMNKLTTPHSLPNTQTGN